MPARTLAPLLLVPLLLSGCGGAPAAPTGSSDTGSEASTADATATPTTGADTTADASSSTGEPAPVFPGACETPISPVVRSDARLTVDAGGVLRDEHGRDVQLRGINTGGRSKWAPFVPFPVPADPSAADVAAAAPEYFARLQGWGLDTVRMPFSWEALEPSEGAYDDDYLDRYEAMVDAAWALGIRVIVDFHQDVYASPFCGDGFPLWTISGEHGPPRHDCPDWGLGYLDNDDVRGAFDRFWADEDGLQDRYLAMWEVMAGRFAEHPGVVGLELINEPGWGTAPNIDTWKLNTLTPFHTKVIAHMRGVIGEGPLLLFDNTGVEAVGFSETLHLRPEGDNLMYAPHIYDPGLISGEPYLGNQPEVHLASIAAFSRAEGMAALIGEFGYGFGAEGGEMWLTRLLVALDSERVSATLWEYSQSEELWNEEDLSVVDGAGDERPILDVYVRPWLRAVAGTAPTFTWDAEAGAGVARWTADGGVTELVLPRRRFPDGPTSLTLSTVAGPDGACHTFDRERGEVRVQAPAGAQVELSFAG